MNDQYIIPLFVAGSLLLTLFAFFLIAYLLVQKRKQNAYQLEKQQMIFNHENSLLRAKLEEQESAMNQISIELHDNLKGILSLALMNVSNAADMATDKEQIIEIDMADKYIEQVVNALHDISHSLNSNFIRQIGLVDTITKDLQSIGVSKKINYDLDVTGKVVSLSPERDLHIYRIAQEAIQNSLKHARATNLIFALNYEPHLFTMTIRDNGVGFDRNKILDMKGLGLLNMFQRAKYVNGSLDIQSAPGEGSSITLTVNLDDNGADN